MSSLSFGSVARSFIVVWPFQPVRSLPLNRAVKPGGGVGASAAGERGSRTTNRPAATMPRRTVVRICVTPTEGNVGQGTAFAGRGQATGWGREGQRETVLSSEC